MKFVFLYVHHFLIDAHYAYGIAFLEGGSPFGQAGVALNLELAEMDAHLAHFLWAQGQQVLSTLVEKIAVAEAGVELLVLNALKQFEDEYGNAAYRDAPEEAGEATFAGEQGKAADDAEAGTKVNQGAQVADEFKHSAGAGSVVVGDVRAFVAGTVAIAVGPFGQIGELPHAGGVFFALVAIISAIISVGISTIGLKRADGVGEKINENYAQAKYATGYVKVKESVHLCFGYNGLRFYGA